MTRFLMTKRTLRRPAPVSKGRTARLTRDHWRRLLERVPDIGSAEVARRRTGIDSNRVAAHVGVFEFRSELTANYSRRGDAFGRAAGSPVGVFGKNRSLNGDCIQYYQGAVHSYSASQWRRSSVFTKVVPRSRVTAACADTEHEADSHLLREFARENKVPANSGRLPATTSLGFDEYFATSAERCGRSGRQASAVRKGYQ
jgi:hypothetical protein